MVAHIPFEQLAIAGNTLHSVPKTEKVLGCMYVLAAFWRLPCKSCDIQVQVFKLYFFPIFRAIVAALTTNFSKWQKESS